jgi:alpha-L-rhamnosidase
MNDSVLTNTFSAATWIWYPGDFEIVLANKMQNRRTERGTFFPVFWKIDNHYVRMCLHLKLLIFMWKEHTM